LATSVRPAVVELREISKRGGGVRTLTTLSADDSAAYALAVDRVAPAIERVLDRGVFTDRALAAGTRGAVTGARARWRAAIVRALRPGTFVIAGDVMDCYPSIAVDTVATGLAAAGAEPAAVAGVRRALGRIEAVGTRGLPVGPAPSALVANAVLAIADRAVRERGATLMRWVDDVIICADDRHTTVRAFDAWTASLRWLGLTPHDGKTRGWAEHDEALHALLGAPPSGADRPSRGMIRAP
jgi:hypothetical protein